LRDFEANAQKGISAGYEDVAVIHASADADDRLISALLHSSSELYMGQCIGIVKQMTAEEKEAAVKKTYRHMQSYDAVLREFEYIDLNFELIISATCFAQLKRHRMATITCQDYNPGLGTTVPPVVSEAGMETAFLKIIARTNETYDKLKKAFPASAAYVLTNAHRRRVSIKVNARELYHISRLRGGRHAQWDIRQIAIKKTELGRKIMPLTLMLAVGKDDFKSLYETTQNV
jgi:thymidylate synthase ThyX